MRRRGGGGMEEVERWRGCGEEVELGVFFLTKSKVF